MVLAGARSFPCSRTPGETTQFYQHPHLPVRCRLRTPRVPFPYNTQEAYRALTNREARAAVAEFLQRFDPNKNCVARTYIRGGGAKFYSEALRARLGGYKIELIDDYVMANARGF